MYLKTMITISLAALCLALFLPASAQYRVLLQFLVCASAALIVVHALRGRPEYFWAGIFFAVAGLFNPIIPVALSGRTLFSLELVCILLFFAYYLVCKTKPRTAMVSIAEKNESRTL